ncbi:uncharacterized protein LOC126381524 [Pectinophora gossypiella]|uniref:uncharacterized protein LOC126381524 n=1 Tax=Pectinophora gossypiella TaxID=13191 RepID=UPI00214E4695|nr:uncharacterized protein LOC126381524 [Pectinophora gossypiella]
MSIGKLSEYNVKVGSWSSYVERLKMYYKVNTVKDDMKLPILIASMGDEAYELLENLSSPTKPADLTFEKVDELMRQHLQPTPSALAERYRYRQRRQNAGENIAVYVAELKRLSKHCKFEANLCENLRDQFVCGLRSDVIRQRLFAEDDTVTFNQAVKLATSLEAAERDSAVVEENRGTGSEAGAVHAIASSPARGTAPAARRAGGLAAGAACPVAVGGGTKTPERRFYGGDRRHGNGCGACGAQNHNFPTCRFRDYVCSKCQRTGHLRRVCPEWGAPTSPRGPPRRGAARGGLHFREADRETSEEVGGDIEEELHHLSLNDYKSV